ncbi:MAG: hypothetical protein WBE89_06750 [Methyloceanibacter sp.]
MVLVVAASLFAEPLNVGFGLFPRWVNLLTNLGDALVLARWLYVDDETLLIGCANDPPIRESRIGMGEQKSAYQD